MEKYEIIKEVGDGSFGSVTKARNKLSNEIVAIKRMKAQFASWDEAMKLREVKSLRKLNHHNIVKLKEVIRQKDSLYFVFEFMEKNLYEIISKGANPPTEQEIKTMAFDTLQGIAACHKNGYFHRDLKPENILMNSERVAKLCDFGLAREIRARPPFTEYVSTRWYRAPELLLNSPNYNSPIDIFAMGCILAEMYLLRPLAPGNSEADQLTKVCAVLGTPPTDWTDGYQLATTRRIDFPRCPVTPLSTIIPNASSEAIDLLNKMLLWDPHKRPTANQCLQHPFFTQDVRAEHARKMNVQMQQEKEEQKRAQPANSGNNLRNSQNNILTTHKQPSSGIRPHLGAASQAAASAYLSKAQDKSNANPLINVSEFASKHSEATGRSSGIAQRGDSYHGSGSNRNNSNGIHGTVTGLSSKTPLGGGGPPNKPWEAATSILGTRPPAESIASNYMRNSVSALTGVGDDNMQMKSGINRGSSHNIRQPPSSNIGLSYNNQKLSIAPKLNSGLLKSGAGLRDSSSGIMGSQSILNTAGLAVGDSSGIIPTKRGLYGNESSNQLHSNEESKIGSSSMYDEPSPSQPPSSKNPSYFSHSRADNKILSPHSTNDEKPPISQTSRNMSVLNIKKSSARFLNPISSNFADIAGGLPPASSNVFDKYPMPKPLDSGPMSINPRTIRENKNSQMFDKYMNNSSSNRKTSVEMPSSIHSGIGGSGSGEQKLGLPVLGQGPIHSTFSAQKNTIGSTSASNSNFQSRKSHSRLHAARVSAQNINNNSEKEEFDY